jgi:hypothetical protein
LGGDMTASVSHQIGADEAHTTQALSAAVPLLVSALARNASKPDGAQSLHQALKRDHDGSILNDVPKYFEDPKAANGAGILGHVLGEQRGPVENRLAQQTGLDAKAVGQLLELIAPILLGALGRTQREEGLSTDGLAQFLGGQQQVAQDSSPDVMGILGDLLDSNDDGSVIDDIGNIAGALLGGKN